MNPDEPAYIVTHAWALFPSIENKSQVTEETNKALSRAISANDKIPENYYYLGSIYKHEKNLKKVEEYYKKAVELDPSYI